MANCHLSAKPIPPLHGAKRAPLVQLKVSTQACPDVLGQVLDTLARQAVIPWGIEFRRTSDGLSLAVDVENFHDIGKLATRIEVLAMVREVCVVERMTGSAPEHG